MMGQNTKLSTSQADRFEGRSSVSTWLISIARFKGALSLELPHCQPLALLVVELAYLS
jgi:hypothetical protein